MSYTKELNVPQIKRHELRTNNDIADDLFSSIEYFSEIDEEGVKFFNYNGSKNPEKDYKQFQAFVRQGKTFYKSASTLGYRSSPLIYYYCFLNLVKAYLTIIDASKVSGEIHHGLSHPFKDDEFLFQKVKVKCSSKRDGVFSLFYNSLFSENIGAYDLNIFKLLAYSRDVSYEYHRFSKFPYLNDCKYLVTFHNDRCDIQSIILGIRNFSDFDTSHKSFEQFMMIFEQVEVDEKTRNQYFNLFNPESADFTFLENKSPFPVKHDARVSDSELAKTLIKITDNFREPNVYGGGVDFYLNPLLEIEPDHKIPFREILSVYVVMFYLGSLVRYHPYYLEKILNHKESWLIKQFVKSSPITFLRHIRNLMFNEIQVYVSN